MKRKDLFFAAALLLFFLPFLLSEPVYAQYISMNHNHEFAMAFIKFAVLATLGEVIGLRIKTGNYYQPGFGILPHALVWGIIGVTIKAAFIIFTNGTPFLLEEAGFQNASESLMGEFSFYKLFVAFCTSLTLNLIYAPVMMTMHRMMDIHISQTGGTIQGLFTPIHFKEILINLDWDVQWNFVFKKTIPFFWIPAHTITFLLPVDFQVLFAALLGISLGTILSVASLKSKTVN